jgi:hypothetical protein
VNVVGLGVDLSKLRYAVALVLIALLALAPAAAQPAQAAAVTSLTSNPGTGQPVGTTVTWTAVATGNSTLRYRFSVATATSDFLVVRDFSPNNSFKWTPMEEGGYRIRVTAKDTAGTAELTANYVVRSRATGTDAVVTPTAHPMVALYSLPPCSLGSGVFVEFRREGAPFWQTTNTRLCQPGKSINFLIAGMRGSSTYLLRHVVRTGSQETRSPTKPFTTGAPGLAFPATSIVDAADTQTSLADGVLLQALAIASAPLSPVPMATDLNGQVVWYYDPALSGEISTLHRPVPGGTFLTPALLGDLDDQILREIDLAGNTLRETNTARINEQLAALGKPDTIGAFHHETNRLPNGHTIALASVERVMNDVQGAVGSVDILGDIILVLDVNWQVVWYWNVFDHLDINRKAILSETCVHQGAGCPPLFKAVNGLANDWTHGNAVTYSPQDGHLIFSMRHQDWVFKINYANGSGNGQVVWRLGKDGNFDLPSSDPYPWFSHQHDARYIGANQIVLCDNGNTRCVGIPSGCNSRGQALQLVEPVGTNKGSASLVLNADLGHLAFALGSAEKLANGNFHFNSGILQPGPFTQAVEVLPNGTKTYVQQTQAGVYRSFRKPNLYVP